MQGESFSQEFEEQTDLAKRARESILSSNAKVRSRENAGVALGAAEDILRTGPEAGFGQPQRQFRSLQRREQQLRLAEAACDQPLPAPQVANEGEHRVHHDEAAGQAVKDTNGGRYGVILDQEEVGSRRKLELRDALPSEYFWRLGLMNVVFGDSIQIEAITRNPLGPPSIQTSQPWIIGEKPSVQEIREFMETEGFRGLPRAMLAHGVVPMLSWYRPADGILVYDTKDTNFIRSGDVVTPIDLCLGLCPPSLMEETARLNGVNWMDFIQGAQAPDESA